VQESVLATWFPLAPPIQGTQGDFVDALWTFSVSELFLAHPDWQTQNKGPGAEEHAEPTAPYLEFELTPDLQWIALAFEGRRRRTPLSTTPDASLWKGVQRFRERACIPSLQTADGEPSVVFGMTFPWSVVAPCIHHTAQAHEGGVLLAQGALSLGQGRFFLAPHWSRLGDNETHCLGARPANAPDFHQPTRFEQFALK
jgi:hypothetical protein